MYDYKLLISLLALLLSIITFGWNIWNKIKSEKKKLNIRCYKVQNNEKSQCVITLTNIGCLPIFIRRIELKELRNGKSHSISLDYKLYKDRFENKPLNPNEWQTIIFYDTKYLQFFDDNKKTYKRTKILIIEPNGKKHSTKWFNQNNLK